MIFDDQADALGGVRARPVAANAPRSLAGSAYRLDLTTETAAKELKRPGTREWQKLAWEYYDAIGEVKFAFNLVASVMSRIRLYPAVIVDESEVPVHVDDWMEKLDEQEHSESGQLLKEASATALEKLDAGAGIPEILRTFSVNASVAGEMFLVDANGFRIVSVDELVKSRTGRGYALQSYATGDTMTELPNDAYVARIWRNHPRKSREPESSMLGVLDQCEKLVLIDKAVRAVARSRMSAGLVFIPDGITIATSEEDEETDDAFEQALIDGLTSPIADEASATTVVPLILRGPPELGEKIKPIEIGRILDPSLIEEADKALDRTLSGIDVPKDIVTGLADVKYANAIVIDDSLYRAHVEPGVLLFVDCLSDIFLRPMLRKAGVPEALVKRAVIWYDPSSIVTRPDRSQAANEGWDRGVLSDAAWRSARGFSDADAPDEEERIRRLAFAGQLQPATVEALVEYFAPEIFTKMRRAQAAAAGTPPDVQNMLTGGETTAGEPGSPAAEGESAPTAVEGGEIAPGGQLPPTP